MTEYDGSNSVISGTRGIYVDVITIDNSDNSFDIETQTKFNSATGSEQSIAWDENVDRLVLVYTRGTGGDVAAMVGEFDSSDNSWTVGSEILLNADYNGGSKHIVEYWSSAQKVAWIGSPNNSSTDTSSTPNHTFIQLMTVASSGQTLTLSSNRTTLRTEYQADYYYIDAREITSGNYANSLVVMWHDSGGQSVFAKGLTYVSSVVTVSDTFDEKDYGNTYVGSGSALLTTGTGFSIITVAHDDPNDIDYVTPLIAPATTSGAHYQRWIGIANSAISDGASGTITSVGGIGTGQSSLTVGSMYSINTSGALEERGSFYGAASYANVGVALTASTIYITGGFSNG